MNTMIKTKTNSLRISDDGTEGDWLADGTRIKEVGEVKIEYLPSVPLPRNVFESLKEILPHFLPCEKKDFEARSEKEASRHCYSDLSAVDRWLKGSGSETEQQLLNLLDRLV
jgi:hypothetical protein